MSITIPSVGIGRLWARTDRKPKHSAPVEVERLRGLLAGANALIKGQSIQLADVEEERDKATERLEIAEKALEQAEGTIRLRDRRIAELEQRIAVGVKAEHVIARTQEIPVEEIRRHCTPVPLHQSPLANPAHVPAWAQSA